MILKKFIIGIFLFFLGGITVLAQESYNRSLFEGNRSFGKEDYKASEAKFKEAAKLKNNDFAAHYNLANSYYKQNRFEEAKSEYERAHALAKTKADKMASLYNLGNANMKTNAPDKAAEYYKQSLKQDPYNEKIRKNYEIAKLKEQEQNKDSQQNKNNGGNGKNKDQNQKSKDGKNPENGNSGQNASNPNQGEGKEGQKPKENSNMPKDLENAIMNRVSDKERETARKILNKNSFSMPESNEKDW